ncbi:uncharacterized protein LOC126259830 [Schistocerca nitens]|uniref:uncharacterized protein LOC126259830 n=1 Tax=Schistocerca nitens TaxID=7011 RepID=UPI0021181A55|nr:uncharacterized protein LOC126259830 [Schistocerca nitens]
MQYLGHFSLFLCLAYDGDDKLDITLRGGPQAEDDDMKVVFNREYLRKPFEGGLGSATHWPQSIFDVPGTVTTMSRPLMATLHMCKAIYGPVTVSRTIVTAVLTCRTIYGDSTVSRSLLATSTCVGLSWVDSLYAVPSPHLEASWL